MKTIGVTGIVNRINLGQQIEFYGDVVEPKFDSETLTPYATLDVGGEEVDVPLVPGDIIGVEKGDTFEDRLFTGKYYRRCKREYRPFGMPVKKPVS